MSFELKTENCLYMDCGGCVNDESTAEDLLHVPRLARRFTNLC